LVGPLLLILSVGFGAILCHKNIVDQFRDARIALVASACFWLTAKIYTSTGFPLSKFIAEISLIITFSGILVALLMMIRKLKPEIFRYPYVTVFMPVVIPFSYYLIYQTSLMKDTIVHSVSAMIVLVSLIITIGYKKRKKPLISMIAGSLLLAASLSVSFFLDEDQYIHLLWYLITSVGIAVTSYGFIFTFNRYIDT